MTLEPSSLDESFGSFATHGLCMVRMVHCSSCMNQFASAVNLIS